MGERKEPAAKGSTWADIDRALGGPATIKFADADGELRLGYLDLRGEVVVDTWDADLRELPAYVERIRRFAERRVGRPKPPVGMRLDTVSPPEIWI